MPPNHFESEVESFLEGSHGDRTHIKRADHHTVTPLCGTLLFALALIGVLVAMACISFLNSPLELLWNHSVKERDDYGEQLSTLRLVRPLLAGRSRSAVESRSSVVSCARLRAVVDWD